MQVDSDPEAVVLKTESCQGLGSSQLRRSPSANLKPSSYYFSIILIVLKIEIIKAFDVFLFSFFPNYFTFICFFYYYLTFIFCCTYYCYHILFSILLFYLLIFSYYSIILFPVFFYYLDYFKLQRLIRRCLQLQIIGPRTEI